MKKFTYEIDCFTIYTTVAVSRSTRNPAILGIETLGKLKYLILRR